MKNLNESKFLFKCGHSYSKIKNNNTKDFSLLAFNVVCSFLQNHPDKITKLLNFTYEY